MSDDIKYINQFVGFETDDPTVVVPLRVQLGLVEINDRPTALTSVSITGMTIAQYMDNPDAPEDQWSSTVTFIATPEKVAQIAANMLASVFGPNVTDDEIQGNLGRFVMEFLHYGFAVLATRNSETDED